MLVSAFEQGSAERLICNTPALLTGVLIHSTDATGKITLYDGQDALSGMLFGNIASPSGTPFLYSIPHPILFGSGIYVTVTATIEDYTICFIPLRGNSPLKPYTPFVLNESDMSNE